MPGAAAASPPGTNAQTPASSRRARHRPHCPPPRGQLRRPPPHWRRQPLLRPSQFPSQPRPQRA
eukprot:354821-Chlamydomonas_euryale.AAC.3